MKTEVDMKLTLIAHPTFDGANDALISKIKAADKSDLSEIRMLVVPDRYTLTAEEELLKAMGTCLNVQVTTFRRFASRIVPLSAYVGGENCVLILTRLITENRKDIPTLTGGGITYGLVRSLRDVINQLRYSLVKPENIIPEKLPERLRGKIADIRTVYKLYLDYLGKGYSDSSDKLSSLSAAIPYSDTVANAHFYFKDFDNFSAQETEIVEKLVLFSKSVTVSSTFSDESSHCSLYLNEVFSSVRSIAAKLIDKNKLKPENFDIEIGNVTDEDTAYLQKYLMSALVPEKPRKLPKKFFLYNGSSPSDEVRGLARYISDMVAKGAKFGDFTVILSDAKRYSASIDAVFPSYGIPYFLERKSSLLATPLGQFVTSFFRLSEDTPSVDRIASFAENFYFAADYDDLCAFRNYVEKYNCRITEKPFAYEKDSENYVRAERIRKEFLRLAGEPLPKTAAASLYTQTARRLVSLCNAEERTGILSRTLKENDFLPYYYRTERAVEKLTEILDSIEEFLGETEVGLKIFSEILSKGMEAADLSVLPITRNTVEFIEMAKARRHNYGHVAVLGANDEVFPIIKSDSGLLSDENLEILARAGADIRPSVRTLNQRERFDIYQLFLEKYRTLRISYASLSPIGGKILSPSVCVKSLVRIFVGENGYPAPVYTRFYRKPERYMNLASAKNTLLEILSDSMSYDLPVKDASPLYYLTGKPPAEELLTPPPPDYADLPDPTTDKLSEMSASRVESYYSCPLKHFLRYEVGLKPRQKDEDPSAALIGTLVHEVLEKGLLPFVRNPDFSETPEQTARRSEIIFDRAVESDDYIRSFLAKEKNASLLRRLKAECSAALRAAIEQTERSDFKPAYLERRFGNVLVGTEYGKTRITGIIDRTDVFGNKAVVVDYKTGSADFSDKALFMGTKLQLTTYITALSEQFEVAGLYYMKLNDKYRSEEDKSFCWSGLTVDDAETAEAIDNDLRVKGKSLKLGIEKKNDGQLKRKAAVVSEDTLKKFEEYTLKMYENAVKACYKGHSAPSPVENACEFCDYAEICPHFDTAARPER